MRTYVVFGSNDGGKTLVPLGTYEAADHDGAKRQAREHNYKEYGSCPSGNWSFGKLKVKEVVEFEPIDLFPGQMTVDEVLEETKEEKIEEAKEAIKSQRRHPEKDENEFGDLAKSS